MWIANITTLTLIKYVSYIHLLWVKIFWGHARVILNVLLVYSLQSAECVRIQFIHVYQTYFIHAMSNCNIYKDLHGRAAWKVPYGENPWERHVAKSIGQNFAANPMSHWSLIPRLRLPFGVERQQSSAEGEKKLSISHTPLMSAIPSFCLSRADFPTPSLLYTPFTVRARAYPS